MEQNLTDALHDAYQYLACLSRYDELITGYQNNTEQHREKYRQLKARSAGKGLSPGIFLIFLSPMIFIMLAIFFAAEGWMVKPFAAVMLILLIGGPFFASKISKEKENKRNESFQEEAVRYWQTTGGPAEQSNQQVITRISEERNEFVSKNGSVLEILPPNYRNTFACGFILTSVVNKRADSLKEAINLYEETLHRMRMENAAQNLANAVRDMQFDVMNQMTAINANIDRANSRLRDIENLEFYNTFYK